MENLLSFIGNHRAVISLVLGGLVGIFLPTPKFWKLGNKLHDKIPKSILKLLNERIDAFQEGLLNLECNGCTDIISNEQLKNETKKLKKELGLGK